MTFIRTHLSYVIAAAVVLLLALILGGWYILAPHPVKHGSDAHPNFTVNAIKGVIGAIGKNTIVLTPYPQPYYPKDLTTRTVFVASTTVVTIKQYNALTPDQQQQEHAYQAMLQKAQTGDAAAKEYVKTHNAPSYYTFTTTRGIKSLKQGDTAVVINTDQDLRTAASFVAKEIEVDRGSPQQPVSVAPAAPKNLFASALSGLYSAFPALAANQYHEGPLEWNYYDYYISGHEQGLTNDPNSAQAHAAFWCMIPGYTETWYFYDDGSNNNAKWFACIGNDVPMANLTATSPVQSGQPITLTWTASNVTSCSIDNGVGAVTAGDGSTQTTAGAAGTYTYTLTCTNGGTQVTSSAQVQVTPNTPAATAAISADQTTISQGSSTTVRWSSTDAKSCTGTNFTTGGATSGAAPVTPSSTTTYSVVCTGDGGTSQPASVTITVVPPPPSGKPDLTADQSSTASVQAGAAATLTGTIRNTGDGAGNNFWNLLQICNDVNCSSYDDHSNEAWISTVMNPGDTQAVSAKATAPATAGNYVYRWCANHNTNWVTTVDEKNTGDDCGGWANLTVNACSGSSCVTNPPGGGASCSISLSPTSIKKGGSATLTWTSSNTTSCTGVGFSTGGATSGSVAVSPASNTDYSMDCANSICHAQPQTLQVGCNGTPTPVITADSKFVKKGSKVKLTFSGGNVETSCVLTGPTGNLATYPAASCTVAENTYDAVNIQNQSKFCYTCDGGTPACVVVNVKPDFIDF